MKRAKKELGQGRINHFLAWMDDATQDAQGMKEDGEALDKAHRGDWEALETARALLEFFEDRHG